MASVETSVEVDVPVDVAYNQWTQFESFPKFMSGIQSARQVSDNTVEFRGEIGGHARTWTARIMEQTPDERISWRSIEGAKNGGTVLFEAIDDQRCRVTLLLDYDPEGFVEKAGDLMGIFEARVKSDLDNFKDHIEGRGVAEDSWRGEIHGAHRTS